MAFQTYDLGIEHPGETRLCSDPECEFEWMNILSPVCPVCGSKPLPLELDPPTA